MANAPEPDSGNCRLTMGAKATVMTAATRNHDGLMCTGMPAILPMEICRLPPLLTAARLGHGIPMGRCRWADLQSPA